VGLSVHEWVPSKIIVYFHGNAECISTNYQLAITMCFYLRCSVLVVEYPGYGLYTNE
jgi:hypothetical protein